MLRRSVNHNLAGRHAEIADIAPSASPITSGIAPTSLILGAAVIGWLIYSYGYIEDDAFIHLEFARSVSEGLGFSFNGQHVNGDTAPLWVLLLAAIHALGLGWIAAAKSLAGIGVVLTMSGVWRICRDLAAQSARHRHLALFALLVTSLNPYFVHWSFSGMEAITALGVSIWAIWAAFPVSSNDWRRVWTGVLAVALAPLLRPELVLLAAITGPALLYRGWRLSAHSSDGQRLLSMALLAAVMAVPTLLWCGYALHSFGSLVPTTNAAKRGGNLVAVATKLISVYLVGFAAILATLPFVIKRLTKPGVPTAIWVLLLWPLACVAFYLVDHTAVQTRYCLLSMPSLAIAVLWLLEESTPPNRAQGVAAIIVALSVATVALIVFPHVANKVKLVRNVSAAAEFIRDKLPPDAPVAVYSIGQFAFEGRHPLIDIGGITRPDVLPNLGELPTTIRWAKAQGARYYIGGDPPESNAAPVFSFTEPFLGWTFRRSRYATSTTTGIYRFDDTPTPSGDR
jgi:hypothetical protein